MSMVSYAAEPLGMVEASEQTLKSESPTVMAVFGTPGSYSPAPC